MKELNNQLSDTTDINTIHTYTRIYFDDKGNELLAVYCENEDGFIDYGYIVSENGTKRKISGDEVIEAENLIKLRMEEL